MKHDSRYGTTCWICGHPGTRVKTMDKVVYRCCDACRLVRGTKKELQQKRNADVAGLLLIMAGEEYKAQYWSPAELARLARDYAGLPVFLVEQLRWKRYEDSTWAGTKERTVKNAKNYHREYYKKVRKEKKEELERNIQEIGKIL